MKQKKTIDKERQLRQIAEMLLLNGTLVDCPGLIYGKTGIVIFFFHYARYTENSLFEDYAWDLIGEVQNQIYTNIPTNYKKGVAGIAIGIDFLIRNNFIEADEDIFEDFDERMYRAVMYDPWQDFSFYDGLTGYGQYWISRLRYPTASIQARECLRRIVGLIEEKLPDIPEKEQTDVFCFLHDLPEIPGFDAEARHALLLREQCRREWDLQLADICKSFPRLGSSFIANIIRIYQYRRLFNDALQNEINALQQILDLDTVKQPTSMGLLTGYAGEGMIRLTAYNQANTSWMQLL